jgi:hypothetical protein
MEEKEEEELEWENPMIPERFPVGVAICSVATLCYFGIASYYPAEVKLVTLLYLVYFVSRILIDNAHALHRERLARNLAAA